MYEGADEITFGVYACSPEDPCMWKAHDGQKPDEI